MTSIKTAKTVPINGHNPAKRVQINGRFGSSFGRMMSATKTNAYQIAVTETAAMAELNKSELCFLQSFMPPKTAYCMPTARDEIIAILSTSLSVRRIESLTAHHSSSRSQKSYFSFGITPNC